MSRFRLCNESVANASAIDRFRNSFKSSKNQISFKCRNPHLIRAAPNWSGNLLNERSFSMMARVVALGWPSCRSNKTPTKQKGRSKTQMMRIEKAAVLGAGTMGAQIAAHLANAGVPTLLLDIAPRELTPEEQAKGLTLESPQVRNRIARNGLEAAKNAKPAAFFTPDNAALVTVGNFDDDLAQLKSSDLIIEAVVENLDIKR